MNFTCNENPSDEPLFSTFEACDYEELSHYGNPVHCSAGEVFYHDGEPADSIYFISRGTVQIYAQYDDGLEEILSIRGAGEILGDFAPSGESLFGTAQALEQVDAIKVERDKFLTLFTNNPAIGVKILGYLSSKMRDTDSFRLKLLQKKNEQIVRSYEELKNAQDELMKQERFAAVGSLAGKIIHDIKGTITPLKIYSENLDTLSEEARKIGIATIKQSINRIIRICEELLEYIRGVPIVLNRKTVQLTCFIENEVQFLKDILLRNNIAVNLNFSYDSSVSVDEERMGRVLQNMLINAKDAMPSGGTLTIMTEKKDGSVLIIVKDTGCGISSEHLESIFEPFITIGKKKGTGLGLTISKKIVQEHDGTITVVSDSKGTAFTIALPV
ncbi:MAG: sensor histidine kinase [Candidatus Xenobiia bacterium LiM19]